MNRQFYPGGWYADCRPDGAFAVLIPGSHMETHLGPLALPPGDQPLYHRIPASGPFRIAGQAHASLVTWEYRPEGWHPIHVTACGVSPVIYDDRGELHISDCSIGSQGWRYVTPSGVLMTGDQTYGSPFGLSEWTDLSEQQDRSLVVGQGQDVGGICVYDGAMVRLLEPGPCRFIRATRDGDRVALAAWIEGTGAVLIWATVAELRALPPVVRPQPIPQPDDDSPQPIPEKEPPVSQTPNRFDIVQQVAREFPHLLTRNTWASCGEFVQRVLAALPAEGWGHVGKSAGESGYTAPNGTRFSHDVIWHQPSNMQVDILGYAAANSHHDPVEVTPGPAVVQWDEIPREHYRESNKWLPPVPVDGSPAPVPTPVPVPVPVPTPVPPCAECAALVLKCSDLAAAVADLIEGAADASAQYYALAQRVEALERTPILSLDVIASQLQAKSKGGWTGHSHDIEVKR